MNVKIKVIKRAEVEKRKAQEAKVRNVRTEVAMLRLLMERYPEHTSRLIQELKISL